MSFSIDKSSSARERKLIYRSLTVLVKSLEGLITTVDLRNERSVTGLIFSVDAYMNISLKNVAFVEYEGTYKYFAELFIPARMVQDVVIPDHVKITSLLNSALPTREKLQRPPEKKPPRTFKAKRAMAKQQETLRLIKEQREAATD